LDGSTLVKHWNANVKHTHANIHTKATSAVPNEDELVSVPTLMRRFQFLIKS